MGIDQLINTHTVYILNNLRIDIAQKNDQFSNQMGIRTTRLQIF